MMAGHMSDQLIAAVSETLGGVPAELVRRSAAARARAQGATLEEVLESWSGGGVLAVAPATAPAEPAPVEPTATTEAPAATLPAPEREVNVATAPAAVVVHVRDEVEGAEPARLRDRVRLAAGAGAVIGLLLGVVLALASSPLLLDRATVIGEEPFRAGVEVTLTWMIIVTALASAVFGALIAIASRLVPGWFHPEMTLRGSVGGTAFLGALVGAILGAIAAPLTSGLAGETIETGIILSVRGTFLAVLIGGPILGAAVAAVVQLLGEPVILSAEVQEETTVVRHRLAGSILIPLAGLAAIGLLVLPFALLLLEYPSAAPALAIVAAAGILTFAFLAAYQPGLKITRGEFILAAAGIGVVLLFIVLAVLEWGTPAEEHSEEIESLLRWMLI